jgi:hypothetical protein
MRGVRRFGTQQNNFCRHVLAIVARARGPSDRFEIAFDAKSMSPP